MKKFQYRLVIGHGDSFDLITYAVSKSHADLKVIMTFPHAKQLWVSEMKAEVIEEQTTLIFQLTKVA